MRRMEDITYPFLQSVILGGLRALEISDDLSQQPAHRFGIPGGLLGEEGKQKFK